MKWSEVASVALAQNEAHAFQVDLRRSGSNGAIFDRSGLYRYSLWRELAGGTGLVTFVMLNPNLADEIADDPTIRRCTGYAAHWGYRRLEVVNLFARRLAKPHMLRQVSDPVGPANDAYLIESTRAADLIIAAWGNHGAYLDRDRQFAGVASGLRLHCLKLNKSGQPSHPLYLRRQAAPVRYIPR